MVLEILIGPLQWGLIKDRITSKHSFEQEVYSLLKSGTSVPQKSKIVLPVVVTTGERHKIHILTHTGFKPESFGEGTSRYMVLNISKDYFEYLLETYKPIEQEEPIVF